MRVPFARRKVGVGWFDTSQRSGNQKRDALPYLSDADQRTSLLRRLEKGGDNFIKVLSSERSRPFHNDSIIFIRLVATLMKFARFGRS